MCFICCTHLRSDCPAGRRNPSRKTKRKPLRLTKTASKPSSGLSRRTRPSLRRPQAVGATHLQLQVAAAAATARLPRRGDLRRCKGRGCVHHALLCAHGSEDDHQLAAKVARLANKSHKDRVNEFNSKLEALSEHHDIPKVCIIARRLLYSELNMSIRSAQAKTRFRIICRTFISVLQLGLLLQCHLRLVLPPVLLHYRARQSALNATRTRRSR